ncbi:MAG TPA: imidazole glycerol phosphate synthase subunit HisH [Cyclobacteriaceae bacterium]|nr:imidazole glycerol phosphate synthase subunit HisH [Cyclobacteriaceae bacterium]
MKIAIIKYNAGNVQSVQFALQRLGVDAMITDQSEQIQQADRVIFPGVGEASSTMQYLKSKKIDEVIINLKQPVLGICLGMQLMCQYSEENNTKCLGIFGEDVKKFTSSGNLKVPHMGWNQLQRPQDWLPDTLNGEYFYFVHSYYVPVNQDTTAIAEYGTPFSAAMRKNNFYAVQFHPEKSADAGEAILKQFLNV